MQMLNSDKVALTELRLIRTFDRIEMLKDSGRWSFRQPKKQRGLGGLIKTHWDYLMDEMVKREGQSISHGLTIVDRNGCESISGRKGSGKLPSRTLSR